MHIDTGKIRELPDHEIINENEVHCPNSSKAIAVMTGWGKKKRLRYAELVKFHGYEKHSAFYCVEFNNGRPL